MKTSVAACYG